MTIWILSLVLLASLAGIGYRQGAVRVAFSLAAILLGVALAIPLGGLISPLFRFVGVKNPLIFWLLPPFVVFCLISAAFKAVALAVHKKVDVFYKYKAGDLRLALWERLNARLGLCLGLVNGTLYLILLSFVIYIFSYWTVQVSNSSEASWMVKLLNRAGHDLDNTGLVKTARAVEDMPESYYHAADVAGLVHQNPLLEARLSRYPAFLILSETPEFQTLGKDESFSSLRMSQAPLGQLLKNPSMKAIIDNPDLLKKTWATVEPDLADLEQFLETGLTEKYQGERIYGRWAFNASASSGALRRTKPNISSREMKRVRQWMAGVFKNTSIVAGTQNRLVVKNMPKLAMPQEEQAKTGRRVQGRRVQPQAIPSQPIQGQDPYGQAPADPYGQAPANPYGQPAANPYGQPAATAYAQPAANPYEQPDQGQSQGQGGSNETLEGEWQPRNGEGEYVLIFRQGGSQKKLAAVVQGERMTITGEQYPFVFDREI